MSDTSLAFRPHSADASPLWLAMGVVVTRLMPPFRRQTPGLSGVAWRYITAQAVHRHDNRFVVVPCPDFFYANVSRVEKTKMGFQFSCFCKTTHWFHRALQLFPQVLHALPCTWEDL